MSKKPNKAWIKTLLVARQKAGMWHGVKKIDVVKYVCAQMGVAMPESWPKRMSLVGQWVGPERRRKADDRTKSNAFLLSPAWRSLRMRVIVARGNRCECCGASPKDGITINVDHIKPRIRFPELALDEANLQVLCDVCNHGKGNWDETDWRDDATPRLVRKGEM